MSQQDLSADEITLPIKRTTGDTLEERLTSNAYHNILPARYLRKDADGELVESQEDLFERVAKNVALAEAVFEARKEDVEITVTPDQLKPDHPRRDELAEEVFGKGTTADDDAETTLTRYNVNKFSYETIVSELPADIREHVEDTAAEYQELMEHLSFMPNCVPPESRVAAEGGLKPLGDIEPGERVYDDQDGTARVDSKFENGEKLVKEIETNLGYTVQATPEHYFRVISESGEYEWRQVKDLKPDDVIALQKNFLDDEGTTASLLPPTAADGGAVAAETTTLGRPREAIDAPDSMTPALAEWLGLYVGDGTARESGVRVAFDEQDDDLVEYWRELTESVFGFEPTTRHRNDAACVVGQAGRRDLYDFLDRNELLKDTSKNAAVPDAVLESGRTCVATFLSGLFEADGTVGERTIELYTHSEQLADQVQKLLLGLGIRSSVNAKRDGFRVTVRKNVSGKRFVDRVGFLSERKLTESKRFETVAENATSVKIPNQTDRLHEWFQQSDLGHDAYRDLSQFLIDPDSAYHQEIGVGVFRRYAEKYPELWDSPVAEFVERDQFYERVSTVRDVGRMAVEDMQVPRRNTYVVEGFVSHNSPTLMNAGDELQQLSACFVDSPEDDIDDIHQTAKEAAQVFQCLTEDTQVYVEDKGVVSIADVEPGDQIVQRDGDGHTVQNVEETHAYDDSPVSRIETEAGIDLTGTPNHELLVDGSWTRIDQIEAGDTLSLRLGWIDNEDTTPELTTVAGGAQWSENRTISNDDILELHAEGLSDYEIADRLDSSPSTIQRRRSLELGLDPNGSGGRSGGDVSFDEDEFETLYDDGHSDGEIARELGVSTRSVARFRETQSLEANGDAVKTVTQPTEFTPELAELVGMWVGDGSKHEDGLRFHLNREETLERADRLSRDLFDVGLDWRWDEGCYEAVLHSHEIKRWWLANFGDAKPDAASASVPSEVWQADRETIGAFLRGLYSTDGSLQKDTYPRLWSASENLIGDVQQLLLGLGLPAIRWEYDTDERDYYNVGPTGERGLERFLESVGFVDDRSETMAETLSTIDSRGPSVGTREGSTWHVPVEAVKDAGTDTVYDVTVADDHEYVASSVVSHNSGGGMGYAFWKLRPYGDAVGSTGGIASGPITFMRTYDQMCETIAQGGARRGAQMGVMRVSHPDVIQFIHAKNKDVSLAETLRLNDPDDFTHSSFEEALEEARGLIDEDGRVPEHLRNAVEGHLSNFNISVGITDDFMDALRNGEEFTFTNPRTGEPHVTTEETKELYDMFGLGEYVEVGEELSVPAEEIWDHIIQGAHENGEPGVVYLERANKEHSFDVEKNPEHRILATNPCGEQPLEEYEACNLGHINLSTLAAEDAPDWRVWSDRHADDYETTEAAVEAFLEEAINWAEFDHRIEMGTRFLEDVVTMSDFPVEEIEQKVRELRKIGLGIMGLAQLYVQLGMKYGDEVSDEVARKLMTHINHHSKWTSHELAEERGPFEEWEKSKYADPTEYREWFEHYTGEDADEWAEGFPIRNHNTTTIAPTGTTSMVGNTTGGCEPIYNVAYYKNVSDDVQGDEMLVEFDDYFLRVLEENDIDVEAVKKEAQEQMAANEFDGIDGLTTVPDAIGELFVTTGDLSPKQHASIQTALQDGVDSAISKTVNAPNDSTVEDAKEVFEYIYEHGGKGVTYYRDGTRSKQVLTTRAQNTEFADMDREEIVAQIEEVFDGIEGFLESEEVQAALDESVEQLLGVADGETTEYAQKRPRPDVLHGVTQRIDTGYGKLYVNINEDEQGRPFELFANIGNSGGFTASFTEALAKTISTALRSGVDPGEIADELQGIRSPKVAWDKGEQIQSIPDAIGTAMRRYLDNDIERAYPQQQNLTELEDEFEDGDGAAEQAVDDQQELIENGESPECPECGSMSLYYSEGCKTCENCGWSEC
ncbi:adenosylcobalamin-dependent ribonucleoside-diphosphate reductase [Halapricum hydrolyticum]|uniref:Vitamin B12-dependent ribonucleotide reductase n=1 Tax=Halapricum hydrolyticum TaxID=2979991 RepID=A0AAE3LER3_9EURY|nr:adenosylcobalamin-dependent ribonucleoside-diphosphate reductase [Halapricum hydrolyticum]MCU4718184.1 adenosylcobalamin-dependent ribonucleoside-diphosphate reductase [Halapricum hydrolyticum]MCU4726375.1 adenosylcobalamin-dependent ribonucleoside-diphosphate reductase [Halapricum hydrolyticum]